MYNWVSKQCFSWYVGSISKQCSAHLKNAAEEELHLFPLFPLAHAVVEGCMAVFRHGLANRRAESFSGCGLI